MLLILQRSLSPLRTGLVALPAALATGVAAWLSQGLIVYAGSGSERIALLPFSLVPLSLCLAAAVLVGWAVPRGSSARPLLLLALVALPWLPFPLPPALLLWSGPLSILVWLAFAAAMLPPEILRAAPPRHPEIVAGVLALAIAAVAWWQVSPQVPGGDEPHYLVITQSLLKDGDLRIENNHRTRDYRAYFAGELPPDYRVRGRNGEIYSIHAPGVSALVGPAFAVAGYRGAVLMLLVMTAFGSALAWHLAWLVTGEADAAWFGWAAVTCSSTWIFHAFSIYPDGPGAVLLLTGAWALLRAERELSDLPESVAPWFWHGVALAALPWLHTRFSVLAAGVGALVLLRMARVPNAAAKALAFLAAPIVSFVAWLAYFIAIYGTPDPSVAYGAEQGSFRFVPDGLAGLLVDQRFGLLAYAPVLVFAFTGIAVMLGRRGWRRHALELLFVMVPYLIVVTYVAMWWGGRSAPARFFVPLLPWMVVPAAAAWAAASSRATRVTAMAALVVTVFASAVLVFAADGAMAYNVRDAYALWLEWLNGTVDLARGLPVWWRDSETALFRGAAVWGVAAAAAWFLLRTLERRGFLTRRADLIVAAAVVYALAAATALTVVWAAEHVPGSVTTPSQLEALRIISREPRLAPVRLSPFGWMARDEVAPALRILPERATALGGAGRSDRPLYSLAAVPAGEYLVRPVVSATSGWLMIGIGRDQFAIRTETVAAAVPGLVVRFPVAVRALIVRGDEDARGSVTALEVQPRQLLLPEDRLTGGFARHAVRYGEATAFFMDEASYPEPEAFWVGGARSSEVVLQPDGPRTSESVLLRNGGIENVIVVGTGTWREEIRFGPGEERRIHVPLDLRRGATLIRFAASGGFVPADVDPNSRDHRFLGVWVRIGS